MTRIAKWIWNIDQCFITFMYGMKMTLYGMEWRHITCNTSLKNFFEKKMCHVNAVFLHASQLFVFFLKNFLTRIACLENSYNAIKRHFHFTTPFQNCARVIYDMKI